MAIVSRKAQMTLFAALLIGHWIPVWLIGVGAVVALPLWLVAVWYMACDRIIAL